MHPRHKIDGIDWLSAKAKSALAGIKADDGSPLYRRLEDIAALSEKSLAALPGVSDKMARRLYDECCGRSI